MQPKGATKPKWPYRHSHEKLFAAGNGQWAKKINGVRRYFGPWKDPKAALERFRRESPAYYEGDTPAAPVGELTVNDLVNQFLDAKAAAVRGGELSGRMYDDYKHVCRLLKQTLGPNKLVATLRPADFISVRAAMAPSKTRRANEITWARTVFKWGYDSDLIENPVKFGPDFKRPKAGDMRKHKNQRGKKRLYSPAEIQLLADKAPPILRAMIFLAINSGMGNTDCGTLALADLDLDRGVIDNVRNKTGFGRTAPLWPETVKALREYLAVRPDPQPDSKHLVFLTPTGLPLVRIRTGDDPEHADSINVTKTDFVADEFRNLAKRVGIKGKGFYDLRHTFRTIAESGAFKERTISRVMGHVQAGIGTEYIHDFAHERLQAVTDYVRAWFIHGQAPANAAAPAALPSTSPQPSGSAESAPGHRA